MSKAKYFENQIVKIKPYDELIENELEGLYSPERLQQVAGAEACIYQVITDLRAIPWYQIGQWGHNVIEIPETYIQNIVELSQKECNSINP